MQRYKMNSSRIISQIEAKYCTSPCPVAIIAPGGKVAAINDAAKKDLNFIKKNSNIAVLIGPSGMETLKEAVKTGKSGVVEAKVNLASLSGAVSERVSGLAIPEGQDGSGHIAILFPPGFNLFSSKEAYVKETQKILEALHNEKASYVNKILFDDEGADAKTIRENYKKVSRMDSYIGLCLQNLPGGKSFSEEKQAYDITRSLLMLKTSLNHSITALGYRIRYDFEKTWLYFECNEWDFLVINVIMVSLALKNSADRKIDYIFKTDEGKVTVQAIFVPREKLYDRLITALPSDIMAANPYGMNYFEWHIARIVAANNNMTLRISPEEGKIRLTLELLCGGRRADIPDMGLKSGNPLHRKNLEHMLAEFLKAEFDEMK